MTTEEVLQEFIQLSNNLSVALTAEQVSEATRDLAMLALVAQHVLANNEIVKP